MKKVPGQKVQAAGILLVANWKSAPEFLLLRHPRRWDLPKGHCEEGESFEQAALRETAEETGIDVSDIRIDPDFEFELCYPVTYRNTGSQVFEKQVRYFLGYLSNKPQLTLTEHDGSEWFDWNPPHRIQEETIDPLLKAVDSHLRGRAESGART